MATKNKAEKLQRVIRGIALALFLSWLSLGIWLYFQQRSPDRNLPNYSGINLLWQNRIEIGLKHEAQGQIFFPYPNNLVFPSSNSLVSLYIENGNVLWEAEIPDEPIAVKFYDDKFFVMYAKLLEGSKRISFENMCDMGRGASISTYDAKTGELIWENSYLGVDRQGFALSQQILYLGASADHGASWASGQVDANTGNDIAYSCARWYNDKNKEPSPRGADEGITGYFHYFPREVYSCAGTQCQIIVTDHAIQFIAKQTNEVIGQIEFQGFRLHPDNIDLKILDDTVLIYLSDSEQLFAFRF